MLSNQAAKEFISSIFNWINCSSTTKELQVIPPYLNQYQDQILKNMPGIKFPRLKLSLSKEEVYSLINGKIISEDLQFSMSLASGYYPDGQKMTAIEKILYSMIWKNGHVGKEKHLLSGVLGSRLDNQNDSVVFYEFGSYISGKKSHIVDQHTLRCIAVFYSNNENEITLSRKLSIVKKSNKNHINWLNAYDNFAEKIRLKVSEDCYSDFMYYVDRILFSSGKIIKIK